MKYPLSQKSNISDIYYLNYMKIRINSVDDLPLEKTLHIENAIILIRPIFNHNSYHYHNNVCLTKCSYKLAE